MVALSLLLLLVVALVLALLLELLVFAAEVVDVVFLLLALGLTKDEELELAILSDIIGCCCATDERAARLFFCGMKARQRRGLLIECRKGELLTRLTGGLKVS
jgi:hypothetical protein